MFVKHFLCLVQGKYGYNTKWSVLSSGALRISLAAGGEARAKPTCSRFPRISVTSFWKLEKRQNIAKIKYLKPFYNFPNGDGAFLPWVRLWNLKDIASNETM